MTQGFYEQLGVDPGAPTQEIRAAYTRAVAALLKRRKAVLDQGGDPSPLDRTRSQLDEAWAVLQDPARRRRYDALRALSQDGWTSDPQELWRKAAGALVHPAASAAAELLRVSTTLKIGAMPPAPRLPGQEGRRAVAAEDETTVTAPRRRSAPTPRPAPAPVAAVEADDLDEADVVPLTTATVPRLVTPEPSLKVVDGAGASAVVVMPTASPPRKRPLSSDDIARLVDKHGYTGALLKAVRDAKGMTLQEMSETTRISARYLEAIENDQHDRLPSATFVRGYVREMSRLLALDEEATVAGYMRHFNA